MAPQQDDVLSAIARRVSLVKDRRGSRLSQRFSSRASSHNVLGKVGAELDVLDFNSSLGCPLGQYEDATLSLVGGKALQCWRLQRYGFSIPPAFVVPTYVYSLHVERAGVADLIDEVFSSNLRDAATRDAVRPKLAEIREKILATEVLDEVVENVEEFLAGTKRAQAGRRRDVTFAVRSSGSAEDLAGQSFAGQYETFLYKSSVDDVVDSMKACWASMFKEHVLDYFSRPVFLEAEGGDGDGAVAYDPSSVTPPSMGVLVMQMVEADSSGVCFSQNLWGDKSEVMIEAVPGQGEGLVGGEITPDRYVVNKYTGQLVYQDISAQEHKYVRSNNSDGVVKMKLDAPFEQAILSERNLKDLNMVARSIEDFYNLPMDIEWAIQDGKLMILQTRPITTTGNNGSLSFVPPGEGFWTYDPVHNPRPLSKWKQANSYFGDACYNNSRRTGCLMNGINFRFVHQFAYSQSTFTAPSEQLERAAEAYWTKRLYEDDYREFTDFFRPDCEAMLEELRSVNPSSLSYNSLRAYVAKCFDSAGKFWQLHHDYTFPCMVVVGDYMNRMSALTGRDAMETLQLLEASSPESRGLLNKKDPLLSNLYQLLNESAKAKELLQHKNAKWAMDCLLHLPGELGDAMRAVRTKYGFRLTGGYDLVDPSMIEAPELFLGTLLIGMDEDDPEVAEAKARKLADEWKSALPEEKHAEFEEILDVGRRFHRMRDERGLQTDLSGIGLCRRGILEAGRRLAEQGVILEAHHLCGATKEEALALMGGMNRMTLSSDQGIAHIPTPRELERRIKYIADADPNLIPRTLGVRPPEPDPMALPPNIRRTMAAIHTGLLRGIWEEGDNDEDIAESKDKVKGLAASMGNITGPVRVVLNDGDLRKVQKGDIVVTFSCSASFNIVLGLCAGICTDYGGMLSHAAIVAREYGLPAIVGSQHATAKFKDGDVVKIDSSTGIVSLVHKKDPQSDPIQSQ